MHSTHYENSVSLDCSGFLGYRAGEIWQRPDYLVGCVLFPGIILLRFLRGCMEPGSPWENAYIELFDGRFWDGLLEREIFDTLFAA